MKKVTSAILSLAIMGMFSSTYSVAADQKFTLKLAHQMAPDHTLNLVAEKFAELVKTKTNGNVTIKIFPSGALGGEKDNAAALKSGMLDMGLIADEQYPSFVPESAVLVLPYLYKDYAHLDRVLTSDVAKDVAKMILDKTNIRVLTFMPMAFRQMFTVDKEIKTAADLKDIKMRVPESPIYVAAFKQFGAAPTPLAWGEVYAALQTGVVKGVENTPEAVLTASLQEVTKYMNITNHLEGPTTISMSEKVYQKLPKAYQDALLSSAIEAEKYDLELTVSRDTAAREKLKNKLTIVDSNVASFKNAIKYDQIDLVSSPKAKELIKRLGDIK
ncbi:MAG: TRAP transporter substrate-binding protein [Formivibrio sp.]|nr:TRAP transporter substrate-binding protein [Formivibrio sp.]